MPPSPASPMDLANVRSLGLSKTTLLANKAGVGVPVTRPFHSITSSAPLISEREKVTPRVLAAFMLTNSSTFVTS
jgi:hypothetical protein